MVSHRNKIKNQRSRLHAKSSYTSFSTSSFHETNFTNFNILPATSKTTINIKNILPATSKTTIKYQHQKHFTCDIKNNNNLSINKILSSCRMRVSDARMHRHLFWPPKRFKHNPYLIHFQNAQQQSFIRITRKTNKRNFSCRSIYHKPHSFLVSTTTNQIYNQQRSNLQSTPIIFVILVVVVLSKSVDVVILDFDFRWKSCGLSKNEKCCAGNDFDANNWLVFWKMQMNLISPKLNFVFRFESDFRRVLARNKFALLSFPDFWWNANFEFFGNSLTTPSQKSNFQF